MGILAEILDKFATLETPSRVIAAQIRPEPSFLEQALDKYWFRLTSHQQNRVLAYCALAATAIYVISPSISWTSRDDDKMFSRQRPDKYTTGFINMDIDCFANSVLQALAALPGLNEYLNNLYITVYDNPDISGFSPPELPLHQALGGVLADLQRIVFRSKTLSVWDFLSVLERIFKSKISKSQHDAHELLQLILETLLHENLQLYKYAVRSGMNQQVTIPALPFKSLLLNQLQCTVCGGKSNLSYSPMMILTLPVPQESSVDLSTLIKENEKELIDGYSCLRCRLNAILNVETQRRTLSDEDLAKVKALAQDETLLINDDLSPELEALVHGYKNANGFDVSSVKTTINKRNDIIRPPKLLPIHLSRSIFANTQELRNSCQVQFPEELVLETDIELAAKLQEIEEQKILSDFDKEDLEPISEEASAKPSILTDVYEKPEDAFLEDVGQNSDEENTDAESFEEKKDEEEDFVDEDDEEGEDDAKSVASSPVFKKQFEETPPTSSAPSNNDKLPQKPSKIGLTESLDPLAAAPAPDKKSETIKHKYRLKSVIRHVGSHQVGHYECYRHKPIFYKLDSDEYDVQFPFLINSGLPDDENLSQMGSEAAISDSQLTDQEGANSSSVSGSNGLRSRSSSMRESRSLSISRVSRQGSIQPLLQASDDAQSQPLSRSSSRKKPRRFSRRLSSFLSPASNNVESLTAQTNDLKITPAHRRKRLGSFVKYPFWRISDSKITETKTADVLNDNRAVYMLVYERVD